MIDAWYIVYALRLMHDIWILKSHIFKFIYAHRLINWPSMRLNSYCARWYMLVFCPKLLHYQRRLQLLSQQTMLSNICPWNTDLHRVAPADVNMKVWKAINDYHIPMQHTCKKNMNTVYAPSCTCKANVQSLLARKQTATHEGFLGIG